ncbi:hypothetical protein SERLA73DRAFT_148988 [Serpula lacrymans var. lacrymans S7.3]|uniref:Tc1-like transposase DDE domain-containing protein n=1 Tax=Serpula lacrymans var. lacrymans (strain S7.3) TaxID=936435 RepID=F8PHI2_SERL3|nr:hypothetical protein SERLA73DRAFT_148988 [Serpula lacrymans var. lacrymans S7.3]
MYTNVSNLTFGMVHPLYVPEETKDNFKGQWDKSYASIGNTQSDAKLQITTGIMNVLDVALSYPYRKTELRHFQRSYSPSPKPPELSEPELALDKKPKIRFPGIRKLVEDRDMQLLYLPSYSLDLNLIEKAFSAVKAWLRNNCDYVLGETEGPGCYPYALIWEAVYEVITPKKARGWFRDSKYII